MCPGIDIKDILMELKTMNAKGRQTSNQSINSVQSRNSSSYNDRVNSLMKTYDSQMGTSKESTTKASKDLVVSGLQLRKSLDKVLGVS